MYFIKSREHVWLEVVEVIGLSILDRFEPSLIVLANFGAVLYSTRDWRWTNFNAPEAQDVVGALCYETPL